MSRFDQEFALVPQGARWTAVLLCLLVASLLGALFLLPGIHERNGTAVAIMAPMFLLSLVGVAFLGVYVLLIGYIYADAARRGMNRILWTLLAIFIPNAIGIILYFILREPVPLPCPSCGGATQKGHAYCPSCGTAVRPACSSCRQPVEPGWRVCARCGAPLRTTA